MNRLHLDKNNFWRYPVDRALLKPLLKDGTQILQYEKELKIWKLNGVVLQVKNKKTYSKIAGIFLYLFHQIRMCLNPQYRKNFKAAKLKIANAQLELKTIEVQKEQRVFTNQEWKNLIELFGALDLANRTNDRIEIEGLASQIGDILGSEQIDQKIKQLLPIFKKFQFQESPRAGKLKVPVLSFEGKEDEGSEDEIGL